MSNEEIISTVLKSLGKEEDDIIKIKIEALISEILSYLNRDEITDFLYYPIVNVILDYLKAEEVNMTNVQSYREGDISVSFSDKSPFFGRLDSFKLIKGIENVQR